MNHFIDKLYRKLAQATVLVSLLFCLISPVRAEIPDWSVNPNAFEFSMTIVAVIDIQGDVTGNPNNILGAFVGNETRGVSNTDIFVNSMGQYMAFIHVYAHASGEQITFRYYDHSADMEYTAVNSPISFVVDGSVGNTSSPILISNNNWPSGISLSNSGIAENLAVSTTVGMLQATDADGGESFTYSLVAGAGDTDNTSFVINSNMLETAVSFDYEAKNTQSIRVRVTDSKGGRYEEMLTINIQNANDAPQGINLNNTAINENQPRGTVVALISAEDQDIQDLHTFSFATGEGDDNNNDFLIIGNELQLARSINHEENAQLLVRIKASDFIGESFEQMFTITVTDVAEFPSVKDVSFEIDEHTATGTVIGVVPVDDASPSLLLSYTMFNPSVSNAIEIDAVTGEIKVKDAAFLDYETQTSFQFEVRVTDDGSLNFSDTGTVIISLIDIVDDVLPINNFISPNGDGYNDFLKVQNIQLYAGYELIIYNANGYEVFRMTDYDNSWDGLGADGKELPIGSYVYKFMKPGAPYQYKGQVTLTR